MLNQSKQLNYSRADGSVVGAVVVGNAVVIATGVVAVVELTTHTLLESTIHTLLESQL